MTDHEMAVTCRSTERNDSRPGGGRTGRKLGRAALAVSMASFHIGLAGCGGSAAGSDTGTVLAPPPTSSPAPAPSPSPPAPTTYAVTVLWEVPSSNTDGSALTDISGYRVHYGTSPANLAQSDLVAGAGSTSHVVDGLAAGTYYFAVTVVNSLGVESAASNPAYKTVP